MSATVVNRDDEPATEDVYYEITGNVIAAKSVQIPANGTTSVRFDVVEDDTAGFPRERTRTESTRLTRR